MADPRIAIKITLDDEHEGGFQDDFNDHANWSSGKIGVGTLVGTKYGITALDLPGEDIRNLTPERATQYYMERYVKPLYSQIESQLILNKLIDMGILFGIGEAVGLLQEVLKLPVDHEFGPDTLSEINASDPASLLLAYQVNLVRYATSIGAHNPAERTFVAGWIKRINS